MEIADDICKYLGRRCGQFVSECNRSQDEILRYCLPRYNECKFKVEIPYSKWIKKHWEDSEN